jgi:hypothetical protein
VTNANRKRNKSNHMRKRHEFDGRLAIFLSPVIITVPPNLLKAVAQNSSVADAGAKLGSQ